LIRLHQFNSEWWGKPAGIIEDSTFFTFSREEQSAALKPFAWAEFRVPLNKDLPLCAIRDAGFMLADTQVHFRIALNKLRGSSNESSPGLTLRPATEPGYVLDPSDWAMFRHERFQFLPDITAEQLNARYAKWAESLLNNSPGLCFQIFYAGLPQGWFLAQSELDGTVNLALGVLRSDAKVSGFSVYQNVLRRLASMGYEVGHASFSVSNTAVHNIYAQLGARFVRPVGIWLWIPAAVKE
jgi:hypothetical protein